MNNGHITMKTAEEQFAAGIQKQAKNTSLIPRHPL